VSVRFTRAALADLRAVRHWYREQSPGLDREFVRSVEEALAAVEQLPRAYPVILRGARRVLLPIFPYMLFYRQTDDDIIVLGCFHVARNPTLWRRRIDQ